jgi:two-component system, NarL family, response regulator
MTNDVNGPDPIRVLCVDDHPLVRKGIASILANEPDLVLIGEADNGRDAVRMFRELQPDVVLMDLRMPELDGIDTTRTIRAEFPEARILALTSYDGDQDIYRALEAGVRGYLLKETAHADVVHAIRTVYAGRRLMPPDVAERLSEYFPHVALTVRETAVLKLVSEGLGNKEIADRLGTASGTVKMHVQNILDKLGAADRTHAVTMAIRRGILHLT